jgi:hypothetical protein
MGQSEDLDMDDDLEVKPDPMKVEPLKLEEATFGTQHCLEVSRMTA